MEQAPETPQRILYETLCPLSLSTPDQSPPPSDHLEPYFVFRNEISISSLRSTSADTAAPNFISLDVAADEAEPKSAWESPAAEPKTPVPEPKLESGWFRGRSKFKSPMLQLHKEILDFCEFLSPTPQEEEARRTAVERVSEVIKYIWPRCGVEVFGSFKTGLYLPASDIDVVIMRSGIPTPQQGLYALSRALSQMGLAKRIQVIAKARVPIIKFEEKTSGIAFDISFDIDSGPKAAEFIKDAISKWPPLRPLCLILKIFLQQRELNEVYSGGLGSYALLAMLIAMLQSLRESQASPEQNLGVLLVNFFDFYGRKLNTSDVGVSCKGTGTFFSKNSKGFTNKGRPFLIAIEDPQAPENDVGKNSFNYFQIKSAFAMAYTTLTNPKNIMSLGPNRSILGTIIRPDATLAERKGGPGQVTLDSLLPGAGEPLRPESEQQEFLCNWQYDDDDPLPRGGDFVGDVNGESSSGKKRKSPFKDKSKSSGKKGKKIKAEENDSRKKEKASMKKERRQKRKQSRESLNGYGAYVGGSPWSR
ncbi:putative polynucleotide adenylyltransferase [Rosa chinensis]|uniref:polynucleotide adenylyltransferase n=1 Tax=Rosa chinensis TaxID=74649 RepID=A0A2P6QAW4_ROSCH|nr:terminal nucleotidyltransferase 4B [Rosa chinensis]PRQ31304.1 putative polynucleotide adenylyltransferase [Rosa chinensis]